MRAELIKTNFPHAQRFTGLKTPLPDLYRAENQRLKAMQGSNLALIRTNLVEMAKPDEILHLDRPKVSGVLESLLPRNEAGKDLEGLVSPALAELARQIQIYPAAQAAPEVKPPDKDVLAAQQAQLGIRTLPPVSDLNDPAKLENALDIIFAGPKGDSLSPWKLEENKLKPLIEKTAKIIQAENSPNTLKIKAYKALGQLCYEADLAPKMRKKDVQAALESEDADLAYAVMRYYVRLFSRTEFTDDLINTARIQKEKLIPLKCRLQAIEVLKMWSTAKDGDSPLIMLSKKDARLIQDFYLLLAHAQQINEKGNLQNHQFSEDEDGLKKLSTLITKGAAFARDLENAPLVKEEKEMLETLNLILAALRNRASQIKAHLQLKLIFERIMAFDIETLALNPEGVGKLKGLIRTIDKFIDDNGISSVHLPDTFEKLTQKNQAAGTKLTEFEAALKHSPPPLSADAADETSEEEHVERTERHLIGGSEEVLISSEDFIESFAICAALGLPAGVDVEDILSAIEMLKTSGFPLPPPPEPEAEEIVEPLTGSYIDAGPIKTALGLGPDASEAEILESIGRRLARVEVGLPDTLAQKSVLAAHKQRFNEIKETYEKALAGLREAMEKNPPVLDWMQTIESHRQALAEIDRQIQALKQELSQNRLNANDLLEKLAGMVYEAGEAKGAFEALSNQIDAMFSPPAAQADKTRKD